MPYPPKLTPDQWAEIDRRRLMGESVRALAREYGVCESSIRQRLGTQAAQNAQAARVRTAAHQIADSRLALRALTPAQQQAALTLADRLLNVSTGLASAAEHGAATAQRLSALANAEAQRIDDAAPLADPEPLRAVAALTTAANAAASIPLGLLAANRAGSLPAEKPPAADGDRTRPPFEPDWRALLGRHYREPDAPDEPSDAP